MKFVDTTKHLDARPGTPIMNASVSACGEYFEIRMLPSGSAAYWVRAWEVTREVYLDCLATAAVDGFVPSPEEDDVVPDKKPEETETS